MKVAAAVTVPALKKIILKYRSRVLNVECGRSGTDGSTYMYIFPFGNIMA